MTRRTREIGVRIALGAAGRDVMRTVVGQAIALASVGIAIGTVKGSSVLPPVAVL